MLKKLCRLESRKSRRNGARLLSSLWTLQTDPQLHYTLPVQFPRLSLVVLSPNPFFFKRKRFFKTAAFLFVLTKLRKRPILLSSNVSDLWLGSYPFGLIPRPGQLNRTRQRNAPFNREVPSGVGNFSGHRAVKNRPATGNGCSEETFCGYAMLIFGSLKVHITNLKFAKKHLLRFGCDNHYSDSG
jgi:hypothetical protein